MYPNILKDLREKAGLSQVELAKKLGVSRSSIGAYENGTRQPSNDTLVKMSELFGCSVDHLLTGKSSLVISNKDPYHPGMNEVELYDESGNLISAPQSDIPPELVELLEDYRTREGMRMLFKLAHGATEEDLRQAVKIIEALRK